MSDVLFVDVFTGAEFLSQSIPRGRYRTPRYGSPESRDAAGALQKYTQATSAIMADPGMTPAGLSGIMSDVRTLENRIRSWPTTDGSRKEGEPWDPATARRCDRRYKTESPRSTARKNWRRYRGADLGAKTRERRDKLRAERRDPITAAPLTFTAVKSRGRPRIYNGIPGKKNPSAMYVQRYAQLVTALDRLREVCPITPARKRDIREELRVLYQQATNERQAMIAKR